MQVHARKSKGQTLVQVALLLVVLLAFVALAVDVGRFLQMRRQMQNAADAGALAGARVICFGPADDGLSAEDSAIRDARRNGADAPPDGVQVRMPNTYTVEVVASHLTRTYFAGVVGLDELQVGARATAVCGGAWSSCGLWPIAFHDKRYEQLYDEGRGCDEDFFVWHGDNPNQVPDCSTYWCDCYPDNNNNNKCDLTDGDGMPDILGPEDRTYIDFSSSLSPEYPDLMGCDQSGCGAKELGCWIANPTGAKIELGACLPDLGGVKTAVKDEVMSRIDDNVNIPLYDELNTCVAWGNCTSGRTFRVSGFGCIRPKAYHQNFVLPRLDGANPPWKGNIIRVQVNCATMCWTSCGSAAPGPPSPYAIKAVSLIQ